jgi:hypothetical protein
MISVGVFINGRLIHRFDAARVKGQPGQMCTYQMVIEGKPIGKPIKHQYNDGAIVLARKILDVNKIKQPRSEV